MSGTEYESNWGGKVFKCPACGMELSTFSSVCPACGSTIHTLLESDAVSDFEKKITNCDIRIAQETRLANDTKSKILWIVLNVILLGLPAILRLAKYMLGLVKLTPAREEKRQLIKNTTFPDDYWVTSSALLLVKDQLISLSGERFSSERVFWTRLWKRKAEQLFQKAEMLKANDITCRQLFDEALQCHKTAEDKHRKRTIVGIVAWIAIVASIFIVSPWELFPSQEWPARGLATEVPKPMNMNTVKIIRSTEKEFRFSVHANETARWIYIRNLNEAGFMFDEDEAPVNGGESKNSKGHRVKVSYEDKRMIVRITLK